MIDRPLPIGYKPPVQIERLQPQPYDPYVGRPQQPAPDTTQRHTQALIPISEIPGANYSDGSKSNVWYQGELYSTNDFWSMFKPRQQPIKPPPPLQRPRTNPGGQILPPQAGGKMNPQPFQQQPMRSRIPQQRRSGFAPQGQAFRQQLEELMMMLSGG